MDAYGVRGFGSVMSASKLAVATLALHAFAKTCTSFARSRPPASRFTSFRSAVVELTIPPGIASALPIGIASALPIGIAR